MPDLNMNLEEGIAAAGGDEKMDPLASPDKTFTAFSGTELSMLVKVAEHKEGVFDASQGS